MKAKDSKKKITKKEDWKNKLYYGDNLEVMRKHIKDYLIRRLR